jgi:hypothetical protein
MRGDGQPRLPIDAGNGEGGRRRAQTALRAAAEGSAALRSFLPQRARMKSNWPQMNADPTTGRLASTAGPLTDFC